jgi:hypothetical protein
MRDLLAVTNQSIGADDAQSIAQDALRGGHQEIAAFLQGEGTV